MLLAMDKTFLLNRNKVTKNIGDKTMNEIFVGIDLGTTNTLACYLKKGKPDLIRFPGSGKMIPSVLYVDEDGNISVGEMAKKAGVLNPLNVIRSSKTYMADAKKVWKINGREFTPTDVAAEILKEVKAKILKKLKCPPETKVNTVITVPAYFTGNQKDETKKAGLKAGLNVMQIITEPMAAAVAAVRELELDEKVFVVDLGGGTFDISVLKPDQKTHVYRALDIDGDRKLGGDDFDELLYSYLIGIIQDDLGLDLSSQKVSGLDFNEYYSMTGRVREAAELAKIDLSDSITCEIDLLNLFHYGGRNYDFHLELTREEFNDICQPLYEKITSRIKRFIDNSDKFKLNEISTIILAGGSCYIPKVREEVEKIFGKKADSQLNLDTLVVLGACFVAESINGGIEVEPQDILSHSLGIEVLSPKTKKMILSKILNKGDVYPCEFTKTYTTSQDNQTTVPIYVYEAGADAEDIEDIEAHEYYGDVSLENIKKAPAKVPQIRVTFSYDQNGTLVVTAQDVQSGKKNLIEIKKGDKPVRQSIQAAVDFILLLDTSGSMSVNNAMEEAKLACQSLFREMIDFSVHRMGFITFDSNVKRLSPLTNDANKLERLLNEVFTGGTTELLEALQMANSDLRSSTNKKVIIIATDGYPCPRDPYESLRYARTLKESGIRIVTIGAGQSIGEEFIHDISSPGDAYKINNMSELKKTFKTALLAIFEA